LFFQIDLSELTINILIAFSLRMLLLTFLAYHGFHSMKTEEVYNTPSNQKSSEDVNGD
jgi:hypothetical protein